MGELPGALSPAPPPVEASRTTGLLAQDTDLARPVLPDDPFEKADPFEATQFGGLAQGDTLAAPTSTGTEPVRPVEVDPFAREDPFAATQFSAPQAQTVSFVEDSFDASPGEEDPLDFMGNRAPDAQGAGQEFGMLDLAPGPEEDLFSPGEDIFGDFAGASPDTAQRGAFGGDALGGDALGGDALGGDALGDMGPKEQFSGEEDPFGLPGGDPLGMDAQDEPGASGESDPLGLSGGENPLGAPLGGDLPGGDLGPRGSPDAQETPRKAALGALKTRKKRKRPRAPVQTPGKPSSRPRKRDSEASEPTPRASVSTPRAARVSPDTPDGGEVAVRPAPLPEPRGVVIRPNTATRKVAEGGTGALQKLVSLGLIMVLVVGGFLGFVAWRNGGVLDFSTMGEMIAVAFGQASAPGGGTHQVTPPETKPEGLEVAGLRQSTFPNRAGEHLVLVEGRVVNHDETPARNIVVQGRLLSGDGEELGHARAVAGRALEEEELLTITDEQARADVYKTLAQETQQLSIGARQAMQFTLVFLRVPDHQGGERNLKVEVESFDAVE